MLFFNESFFIRQCLYPRSYLVLTAFPSLSALSVSHLDRSCCRLTLRESRASDADSGPSSLRIVIPRDAPSASASARPVVVRAPVSAGSR